MKIGLSKEKMEESFLQYLVDIFQHPEITSAGVRDIVITRETINETGKQAFEAGFHDIYSDTDLSVKVRLPKNGSITPEDYMKRIDRFGVSKDTALGKLYRKDYLTSSHLANMNCNDTVVMQMIMRDMEYGTSHHRFGYAEELEYVKELGKNPYKNDDATFNRIADHLYAAVLSYDRLAKHFYPAYQGRSDEYFAIWDWYESGR